MNPEELRKHIAWLHHEDIWQPRHTLTFAMVRGLMEIEAAEAMSEIYRQYIGNA